mgnify:CR=1 FL=1
MSIRVDRCSCFNVSLVELKALVDRSPEVKSFGSLRKVAREAGMPFGENCKMCRPYVKRMMQTGETVFAELLFD